MFKNKVLLITGGTGSFGGAFLDYVLKNNFSFKEIRIFSRDEKKQEDLRKKIQNTKVKFFIGDVRDKDSIDIAIKNVNFVFHAAALKQVPSCEFYPLEAIKTNILGTNNVVQSCIENSIQKLICLSSDKAVYPINAMGMSKALMEKIAISNFNFNKKKTVIAVTRYGNVLASRGSVLPLFIDQILNNKPLTITDPKMTRFIMPMDKAIKLVLFAMRNAKGGEIFVQKTSASTIYNLAYAVLKIFGKKKYKINIIGTRHGEKKYESLLTKEEFSIAKDFGDYYCIKSDQRDLNYDLYFNTGNKISTLLGNEDYNSNNTIQLSIDQIEKILKKLDILK